ncbi:MAG: glycosyltransferase family 2 protein [Candidatus Omnitrophica bacterium]|nr:glycosyltransferase family 2 protein [Candidatus Omnitrophota bacterium]
MLSDKKVSVIVRTKNEERWIVSCLNAVFSQKHKNFEVIIVDNESSDKTLEKVRQYPVKRVVTCRDYRPGKALNMGIREAEGEYIVSLAGHCIPVNDQWLNKLLLNFDDPKVAGVYGRQEALDFTSDADKRDLALVFGLDRKVQLKDSLFHNANSMIRRDIWHEAPFDEGITNIEDRVWAQNILQKGFKVIYEPEASVYHYHGIHQNGDAERCTNVVRVLKSLHSDYTYKSIDVDKLNIAALIPVKGPAQYLDNKPLLSYTLKRAFESKYIKKTIVSTDNIQLADLAKDLGAEAPFIRDASFSKESVDLAKVYQYSLNKIEDLKILPDIVVCLEITFPFRPKGLIDDMILQLVQDGLDSVIAARRENKAMWHQKEGSIQQIVEGLTPREFKDPTFMELKGVACVTHPEFIRQGNLLGKKIGIYELNDPYSHLEVRNKEDFGLASLLINTWWK